MHFWRSFARFSGARLQRAYENVRAERHRSVRGYGPWWPPQCCCSGLSSLEGADKMIPSELIRGLLFQTTWSGSMASILTQTITPDMVISFDINPGTLLEFLDSRAEGGPRLKCFEGSVTLVSPGKSHETTGSRLDLLILAVCLELGIKCEALRLDHLDVAVRGRGHRLTKPTMPIYIQSQGTSEEAPASRSRHRSRGLPFGAEGPAGRGVSEDPRDVGPGPTPGIG